MNFFKKPLAFIARHPWWTLALAFVFFLLPTVALIAAGAIEVFRGFAVKLLGDAGAKLADWFEKLLSESFWIVSLVLWLIPPLWPLALLLALWSGVDYLSDKGGKRADFSASFNRADAAGKNPGVGDDLFNNDEGVSDDDVLKLFNKSGGKAGDPAAGLDPALLNRINN